MKQYYKTNRIRVLGIAPYEGMKVMMMNEVMDFPEIELTTFVGDLKQGLEIAQENFHGNFDMVISRGQTANLLKNELSIPVVIVDISLFDLLATLRLATAYSKKTALVSYTDMTNTSKQLCSILNCTLDCFTIPEAHEAINIMQKCKEAKYQAVICDVIADKTARELGLNSFLITSGEESIRKAFQEVITIAKAQRDLKEENSMLRKLFSSQVSQTVIFNPDQQLYLSTIVNNEGNILEMLKEEINETIVERDRKITRSRNGLIYNIHAKMFPQKDKEYIAFFFTARKSPIITEKEGISFLSLKEVEGSYYTSLFSLANTVDVLKTKINKLLQIYLPIVIYGEQGTGKRSLAEYFYINSKLKNHPYVYIRCDQLNERSWEFLIKHNSSPFSALVQTIFLENIDKLDAKKVTTLIELLKDTTQNTGNRVICSLSCEKLSPLGRLLADKISAITINTPSLKEQKKQIPLLFNKTLNILGTDIPHHISLVTDSAYEALQEYHWPNNFMQFLRVTKEIAISEDSIVDKGLVQEVIKKEENTLYISSNKEISLSQSLRDIEKDIAIRVVEEEKGNQSSAAKRLKISRTTLWRMLGNNS